MLHLSVSKRKDFFLFILCFSLHCFVTKEPNICIDQETLSSPALQPRISKPSTIQRSLLKLRPLQMASVEQYFNASACCHVVN